MLERRVGAEQFSVEDRVLPLSIRQFLGEEGQGGPGAIQELLQNRTHMGIRSIHSKRDWSTRSRVNELRNQDEEILGTMEGGVQRGRPGQRLANTLESIPERGWTPAFPQRNFL